MPAKSLANLRPWKKGERINGQELGHGCPKGHKRFGTLLQEIFDEMPDNKMKKQMMRMLILDAMKKKRSKLALTASELIMDRMEGKPKETVLTDPPAETIPLDQMPPELREDVLREELAKLEAEREQCPEPQDKS